MEKNHPLQEKEPTFPPTDYGENLEQPRSFLTEVLEVLRIDLNLEDLIVRKNPTFVGQRGKSCHRRKLFPDGRSCAGVCLLNPSPVYDTVRVSLLGGMGKLVQQPHTDST